MASPSEGLRPSDSPTRSLASRFAGSLRSRGSFAALTRSLACRVEALTREITRVQVPVRSCESAPPGAAAGPERGSQAARATAWGSPRGASPRKILGISGRRESNPQPTAWKAVTLPLSYSRPPSSLAHSADSRLRRGRLVRRFENHLPTQLKRAARLAKARSAVASPSPLAGEARLAEARSRSDRAKADGEGRIRTFEGAGPTDLQSAAFDRFATSPVLP